MSKGQAQMINDKIIEANEFMSDDKLIRIEEFKSFLFKMKQNELSLQMKPGNSNEVVAKLVQKPQEYDPTKETLNVEETRDLV